MHIAPLSGALAELLFLPAPCRAASNVVGVVWVFWPFSLFFSLSLFLVMLWRTEYSIHLDASVCSSLGKSAMRIGKRPIQDGIETDGVCACCSGNGSGWAGQGFALL